MAKHRGRTRTAAASAGAAVGATVLFAPSAQAATFTVTSLADDGSEGTFRKEIADADAAAGDDTIVFQSGLSGTIQLANTSEPGIGTDPMVGDIEIYGDSLDIQGPGASVLTIRGGGSDRLFELFNANGADDKATFSGLTLTNGTADSNQPGGAIVSDLRSGPGGPFALDVVLRDSAVTGNSAAIGGGLYLLYAALAVENSTISDNTTTSGVGGGISQVSGNSNGAFPQALLISNSTIADNTAGTGPSSNYDGGGVFSDEPYGDTVIVDSRITGNEAHGDAGGVKLYSSTSGSGGDATDITIANTTFADNTATGYGGGLNLYGHEEINSVTISGSTFVGNTAGIGGGGAMLWGNGAPLVIENSTFTGNSGGDNGNTEDGGGAISSYNYEDQPRTIRNSTIVGNSSTAEGGGISRNPYDSSTYPGPDVLTLQSTIVAGNTATDTGPDLGDQATVTPSGSFDAGFSLIGSTSGATFTENPAGSNLIGVDPLLGPLADNGGPTQTMLPAAGSPAIDAGVSNNLATDQRGLPRTFDDAVANRAGSDGTDIGAVEAIPQCNGLNATVVAKNGTATGTDGADVIVGTHLKDTINSGGGDDLICAGDGNDKVNSGGGKDTVLGEDGKDKGSAGGGKDSFKGGAGKDNIKGGGGADKLKGQAGKDKLSGGGGKDKLSGGAAKDVLKGGPGRDKLNGGPGKDKEIQ